MGKRQAAGAPDRPGMLIQDSSNRFQSIKSGLDTLRVEPTRAQANDLPQH